MVTANPAIENAARELFAQLNIYKDLKFYPSDLTSNLANQYGVSSSQVLVNKFKNLYNFSVNDFYNKNNLVGLDPRYSKALADYLSLTKDEKKSFGIKRDLLGKHGLKASKQEYKYFSQFLKNIGELVPEEKPPADPRSHAVKHSELLKKGSHPSIEGALTGKLDTPNMITIFGKKGDKTIQKGHMTAKIAEFGAPGNVGYIPAIVNEAFGFKQQDTEVLRDTLEKHMKETADKFKNNKNGMYTINTNKNSIDQTRFNNALQREFGKTSGKVPIKKYLELLNLEAEQIGRATDGLITARPIDTQTFDFMKGPPPGSNPKYNIGMNINPEFRDMSFKEIRTAYDAGDPRAMKALETAGNEVFVDRLLNTKKNLKKSQVYEISDKIKELFKGGLINYENTSEAKINQFNRITELADACRGKLAAGGRVKLAKGTNACTAMVNAAQNLDNTDFVNISSETTFGSKLLNFAKRGGKFGALAAVGAAGAGAVKIFMNDDPTTYLSNEDQQKNMLIDMVTGQLDDSPVEEAPIGEAYLPALGTAVVAGTAVTAPSTIDAVRGGALGAKKSGITKTALKTLGKGLAASQTPLGVLATEPLYLAEQIQEGDSLAEMATNPLNYFGPAFAADADRLVSRGLKSPGIAKAMRLGISPSILKTVSRRFGLPGLALSTGISAYETFDDFRNKRGFFSEE
jgi:hypothetical protein